LTPARRFGLAASLLHARDPSLAEIETPSPRHTRADLRRPLSIVLGLAITIIFVMLKKELDYWYVEDRLYNRKLRVLQEAA
jgi:hypothetical protein